MKIQENQRYTAKAMPEEIEDFAELKVTPAEAEKYEEAWAEEGLSSDQALVEYDPLVSYLQEVQRYPLLTREEELELAIRYREHGDKLAAYKLITSNLRLVVKIAVEFQKSWVISLLDLIQEGNIGLMQAVRKFDPYRGVKLSSYASYWIKAYILKFILDNWRLVKIGTTQAQRKLFFNLRKEKERLDRLGFEPIPRLIAENLDVKEQDVIDMDSRMGAWEYSLESPVEEGSRYSHKDLLSSAHQDSETLLADEQMRRLVREKIAELKAHLREKELYLLEKRMLSDKPETLQEIGARWGVSRERVRQIEERLKKKIRQYLVEQIPDFDPSNLELP
ncbi:MAG: RNA polymerase factor sigma-32 [Thermodesulfobacteriota bacterium]